MISLTKAYLELEDRYGVVALERAMRLVQGYPDDDALIPIGRWQRVKHLLEACPSTELPDEDRPVYLDRCPRCDWDLHVEAYR